MNGDLGRGLGHAMFLRVRGREYSQIVREWVTPAAAMTATVRYLGANEWLAVAAGVLLPFAVEGAGLLIGWLDIRAGATRAQNAATNEQDPWKVEMLERVQNIEALVDSIEEAIVPLP